MEHLLKMMERVQRSRKELLVDAMVPTRRQVVILVIPEFLLVQSAIKNRLIAHKKISAKV